MNEIRIRIDWLTYERFYTLRSYNFYPTLLCALHFGSHVEGVSEYHTIKIREIGYQPTLVVHFDTLLGSQERSTPTFVQI